MFKRIVFIFVLGLFTLSASAQFKVLSDTLYAYGYAGATSSAFADIGAETHIVSLGIGDEVIKWVRTTNQLPDPAWTSAVCDIESCKDAVTDTGSFIFTAGDTGLLIFHFYVKNVKATGKMIVRFSRASNPLEYVDVVIFGTSWKPVGVNQIEQPFTSSTPNPANHIVTFNNNLIDQGKIELYNAMGQLVLSADFENHMKIDIRDLAAGIYTVKISGAAYTSFSRIIKE